MAEATVTIQPTDIVWLDLETTGLERDADTILEVGLIISDRFANVKDTVAWVVAQNDENWVEDLSDVVREMHEKSGLVEAVDDSEMYLGQVEDAACAWLMARGLNPKMKMVLAGSTIGFDKAFVQDHAPSITDLFGHRVIDVSSIKETCKRVNSIIADAWAEREATQTKAHRSIADLHASMQEYRFYLDNFLFVPSDVEA